MKKNYTLIFLMLFSLIGYAQNFDHIYSDTVEGSAVEINFNDISSCQSNVVLNIAEFRNLSYPTNLCVNLFVKYKVFVNDVEIGDYCIGEAQSFDLSTYGAINNVKIVGYNTYNDIDDTIKISANLVVSSSLVAMPASGPTTSELSYCLNTSATALTATLTGGATRLKWYTTNSGGLPSNSVIPNTSVLGSTTYWVSQADAVGCESERSSVVVTVYDLPNVPTAEAQEFCESRTVADLVPAPSATIVWYDVETEGVALSTTTDLATGTYYVAEVNANGCESERVSVNVTVNSLLAPIAEAQAFCDATVADLVPAPSTTILWYDLETEGVALSITTDLATGTYYVSESNDNGCESERTEVSVTVNGIAEAPTASAQVFCGSATITDLEATGTNLVWYANETSETVLEPTTAITTGSYYVSQSANGCESTRTSVSVTVNTAITIVSSYENISCNGFSNGSITVIASGGTPPYIYLWSNGIADSGNSGSTINNLFPGSYSLWITDSEGCSLEYEGFQTITEPSIITSPIVTTPILYNQNDMSSPLTATTGGTGLLWYATETGGTGEITAPTPNTSTVGSTSYWVASTNDNGCESERTEIIVTVNSLLATHLNFDGVDDYIDCGNILPESYTKEAWIYMNAYADENNIVSGSDNFGQHALWMPSGVLSAGHNGTWNAVEDSNILELNTWYHVAVSYDSPAQTLKLYKDGVLIDTNTNVLPPVNGNEINIGSYNAADNLFKGSIDEVRIWNVVRTENQINGSKVCELQGTETSLVAYYQFNQGFNVIDNTAITTLTDATVNANHGTLNNFALTGVSSNFLAGSLLTTGSTIPSAPTAEAQVFCGGATVADLIPATSTTMQWYNAVDTALSNTTALETGIYYVTVANANGCESERTMVNVTISDIPEVPTVTALVTYSQGDDASALTATSGGLDLAWYEAETGGVSDSEAPTPSTETIGSTSYWVASVSDDGCYSERVEIVVTVEEVLGVGDRNLLNAVKVYPNPTDGQVSIMLPSANEVKITVYDLNGRLLLNKACNQETNVIDISRFENGVYLLKVISEFGEILTRVIKK
ncbi:LamG-like jellyroll fold domain-containing protein [Winogradskyella psychrotolerans]|nr:LamG-like jellyroll fold domain-containing protein [Winogradskyella psychrotolerans]